MPRLLRRTIQILYRLILCGPILTRPRLRVLGRVVLVLGVVALAVPARAIHAEEPPAGPSPEPLTALEAGPFSAADVVVVGQVLQVREVRSPGGGRGRQLVRVQVRKVLQGKAPGSEEISVMVLGQRPTLDPDRPSVPYFARGNRDIYVLFLAREPGQFAYRLQTLFEGRGSVGREKIAVSQAVARLAAVSDQEEKGRRTLAALIAMSKAAGRWTKAFAARELNYLAGVRPALFDAATQNRLRRVPSVTMTPDQRFWMQRLFKRLEALGTPTGIGLRAGAAESDPWRATFLAAADDEQQQTMLTRLVATGGEPLQRHGAWAWREVQPSVRRWYARALAEARQGEALKWLRGAYGNEEEPLVREEIIRAVGLLGGADDAAWLAQRARNVRLRRAALLALARLDVPEARKHLAAALERARDAGEKDLTTWVEYLLGPEFAESERRAGRR